MFPLFFLVLGLFIIYKNRELTLIVLLVLSMWFNEDVRAVGITVINSLYLFIILLYFLIDRKRNRNISDKKKNGRHCIMDYKIVYKYLIYLFAGNIAFSLIGPYSDSSSIINAKSTFLGILFVYVLLNIQYKYKSYLNTRKIVCFSCIALGLYCIFSYVTASNPYGEFISQYSSDEDTNRFLIAFTQTDARGGLSGRISGTCNHPLPFAILLCCYVFYILNYYRNTKMPLAIITLCLIIISIYLTGSRGVLVGIIVSLIYLYRKFIFKKFYYWLPLVLIATSLFAAQIESITSLFQDDVGGSSTGGRLVQMTAGLKLVNVDIMTILWGNGSNYIEYFYSKYGGQTELLSFESSILSILVCHGVIGVLYLLFGKVFLLCYIIRYYYHKRMISIRYKETLYAMLMCYFIYNVTIGNNYETLFHVIFFIILKEGMATRQHKLIIIQKQKALRDAIKMSNKSV